SLFLHLWNVYHPGLVTVDFSPPTTLETAAAAENHFLSCCRSVNYRRFLRSRILWTKRQRRVEIISPTTKDDSNSPPFLPSFEQLANSLAGASYRCKGTIVLAGIGPLPRPVIVAVRRDEEIHRFRVPNRRRGNTFLPIRRAGHREQEAPCHCRDYCFGSRVHAD